MELKIWIRRSGNGAYLVDKEIKPSNILYKAEYTTYSFANSKELTDWILKEV